MISSVIVMMICILASLSWDKKNKKNFIII